MNSAFLAAGQSNRLKPITHDVPKPLLPFLGKPFLHHLMVEHRKADVEPKWLVVGGAFLDLFRNSFPELGLLVQNRPMGTADAAKIVLEASETTTLLQYGDNLISSYAVRRVVSAHHGEIATVGAIRVEDPTKYGVVETDKQGKFARVIEKPADPPTNLVLAGIYIFEAEMLEFLRKVQLSPRGELELTDALNMAASKSDINVVVLDDKDWQDLTYPWDVLKINQHLMKTMRTEIKGEVERNVEVKGPLFLAENAKIKSGSYIEGPVWIGEGAVIGPNTYLRPNTSVAPNCRVGNACEIKNSVLYAGAHVAHLSYVGDSVIGEGCNLGAGTITANLRFDARPVRVSVAGQRISSGMTKLGCFMGPRVKTGVNVTINPGIKIGADAVIYPGCVVTRDVMDGEIYRCDAGST